MFERFTDGARRVLELARGEAERFNHEYIGTEHLLLGLLSLKDEQELGLKVLTNLKVDFHHVRAEVEKLLKKGPYLASPGNLPLTPRAQLVCKYAEDEADRLHLPFVGTEHLLLGLLHEQYGVASMVLMNLGLKFEDVREEVLNLMGAIVEEAEKVDLLAEEVPRPDYKRIATAFRQIAHQLVVVAEELEKSG